MKTRLISLLVALPILLASHNCLAIIIVPSDSFTTIPNAAPTGWSGTLLSSQSLTSNGYTLDASAYANINNIPGTVGVTYQLNRNGSGIQPNSLLTFTGFNVATLDAYVQVPSSAFNPPTLARLSADGNLTLGLPLGTPVGPLTFTFLTHAQGIHSNGTLTYLNFSDVGDPETGEPFPPNILANFTNTLAIQSTAPIPEPASLTILALAAGLVTCALRRPKQNP